MLFAIASASFAIASGLLFSIARDMGREEAAADVRARRIAGIAG